MIASVRHPRGYLRRRTYSPALDLDGVGTLVEGNYFHDLRSSAINMRGNDQMIYDNFIERAVLESDDQGALDTCGYFSFQGNRIVGNVWKDIGGEAFDGYVAGQAGVRLDDRICGVYVASNVFINAAKGSFGAIQVHGGRANVFEDNVFVNCRSKAGAAITVCVSTQYGWTNAFAQARWRTTPAWHEDMSDPVYRKYPMLRVKDIATVYRDDNVIRGNYAEGCGHLLQRRHWSSRGYYYEHLDREADRNVVCEAPTVGLTFARPGSRTDVTVRYDRATGARVSMGTPARGASAGPSPVP